MSEEDFMDGIEILDDEVYPEIDPDYREDEPGPEPEPSAPEDEDERSYRTGRGNPIERLLEVIGYYDPARRKTAVMLVAGVTAVLLLLLIGGAGGGGPRNKVVVTSVEQLPMLSIGEGELNDDLSNESMLQTANSRRRNSPGAFASSMFEENFTEEEIQQIASGDDFSLSSETKEQEVRPASSSEAAARRNENLAALGITPASREAAAAAVKQEQIPNDIASKYGVSEEAIKRSGLTPEQFEQLMAAAGDRIPELPSEITAPEPPSPQPAEQITIQTTTPTIRRSSGMSSLDSDTWDTSGGMSSLDDDPYVYEEADHPFKVMFCRNEKIRSGQRVPLRLLEDMVVGSTFLPMNTHLMATCTIGERLSVQVTSIEINGRIFTLDFVGYDNDGGLGLYCPNPNQAVDQAERQAGNILRSTIGGAAGGLAGTAISAGATIVSNSRGAQTVSITSGYTFYLMNTKR